MENKEKIKKINLNNRILEIKKILNQKNIDKKRNVKKWMEEKTFGFSDYLEYDIIKGVKLELFCNAIREYFTFLNNGEIYYIYRDWGDVAKIKLAGENYEVMQELREYL